MIWKNAELYNVSELIPLEGGAGYKMARLPEETSRHLSPGGQNANTYCCGCEIRFRIKSGDAKITLSAGDGSNKTACLRPVIYYGGIGAGWQDCFKNVFSSPTVISVPKHNNPEALHRLHTENGLAFNSELVRVILQNNTAVIYDIEGDIEPPHKNDAPKRRYLAYGSSITHGSLGLLQVNTWANRVAENTRSDLINLGFAGNARLEPQMAEYIAHRNDFDFATIEMGINILDIEPDDFRRRVYNFVKTAASAHPDKLFFCIDIFYCDSDFFADGKAVLFRKIVREVLAELNLPNTVHIDGLQMLSSSKWLSGDLLHPNVRGVEEIAKNLSDVIIPRLNLWASSESI